MWWMDGWGSGADAERAGDDGAVDKNVVYIEICRTGILADW